MTPTQIEKLQKKIAEVKRKLAFEKRKFGAYDDSRGLRYLPPKYFIQLGEYADGLKYTKWFAKQFPDDIGFPDFLFEWTIILFKNGLIKDAEKKAFKAFCSNTYLFDRFFERKIIPINKYESSNLEEPQYAIYLKYSCKQIELLDFTKWLNNFIQSEKFLMAGIKFIEIQKRMENEHDHEARSYLVSASNQLAKEF